jgi:hypothetical protein
VRSCKNKNFNLALNNQNPGTFKAVPPSLKRIQIHQTSGWKKPPAVQAKQTSTSTANRNGAIQRGAKWPLFVIPGSLAPKNPTANEGVPRVSCPRKDMFKGILVFLDKNLNFCWLNRHFSKMNSQSGWLNIAKTQFLLLKLIVFLLHSAFMFKSQCLIAKNHHFQ